MKRNHVQTRPRLVVNRFWQLLMECYYCCAQTHQLRDAVYRRSAGLEGANAQPGVSSDCGAHVNLANYTKRCFLDANTDRRDTWRGFFFFSEQRAHPPRSYHKHRGSFQLRHKHANTSTTTRRLDTQLSELPKHRKRQKNEANVKCGHKLVKSDLPGQYPHLLDETGDSKVTLCCIQSVQGGLGEDELSAERGGLPIKIILPTWCTM